MITLLLSFCEFISVEKCLRREYHGFIVCLLVKHIVFVSDLLLAKIVKKNKEIIYYLM